LSSWKLNNTSAYIIFQKNKSIVNQKEEEKTIIYVPLRSAVHNSSEGKVARQAPENTRFLNDTES
jgi:hypothetical protein